jgi:hypothetical protein
MEIEINVQYSFFPNNTYIHILMEMEINMQCFFCPFALIKSIVYIFVALALN